ncbi:MAG: LarC family nickel insertion protein [Alphaproteobacteria bacterium]|nr:LarC family nickel insertion protein [Alphaproteobacteria bacterium]
MHIHLDPVGGIAGDMFAAALLDAWPEHGPPLLAALATLALPAGVAARIAPFGDGVLRGVRFDVAPPAAADQHAHHHHGHHHDHRAIREIRAMLAASPLPRPVAERAQAIFAILAEAEGRVHGVAADDVTFHEVGAWDSIVDIVAAAFLIDRVGAGSWSVAPLPLGSGRVRTAHGELPVPPPAVALLLEGFVVLDDGRAGERVTPTGAAILRHLAPAAAVPRIPLRQGRVGYGFGTKRFPGISNVLRVLALDPVAATAPDAEIGVLRFEVDDQTPEDLAVALERLRAEPGVLDALQAPALGKKGRLTVQVQVLTEADAIDRVADRCFAETTTLGLRLERARRRTLDRAAVTTDGDVRVKIAARPGGRRTAKAEMTDVAAAGDRDARAARRRRAEAAALAGSERDG